MENGPNPERKIRHWLLPAAIALVIAGVVVVGVTRETPPPPPPVRKLANVAVRTVQLAPYKEGLTLPAKVMARRSAAVSAEFGGRLAVWRAGEGARVRQGDTVAELDSASLDSSRLELAARLDSARAAAEAAARGMETAAAAREKALRDVRAMELEVRAAQSARDLAEVEYQRTETLVGEGVVNRATLDIARDARAQAVIGVERAEEGVVRARLGAESAQAAAKEAAARHELAKAQIAENEAAIASLDVQLGKLRLRAPVSGILEEHLVQPGEFVSQGQPLARIYDLSSVRAEVDVPDRFVPFLDPANPAIADFIRRQGSGARPSVEVRLVIPGIPKLTGGMAEGFEVPARIARVGVASDPTSNTFPAELEAPNPSGALKEGLIGSAEIVFLNYPDAVVIPVSAVQVTDEGPKVFVADRQGESDIARSRSVEPLSIRGDDVHVAGELREGDRLIVTGWKGIVPGEAVHVVLEDGVQK